MLRSSYSKLQTGFSFPNDQTLRRLQRYFGIRKTASQEARLSSLEAEIKARSEGLHRQVHYGRFPQN
jgi:hypothetical protein